MNLRAWPAAAVAIGAAVLILWPAPGRRVIQLPAGTVELHSEMAVDANTEVRGAPSGTVLRMNGGRAAIVVRGSGVLLRDFTIDGNRGRLEVRSELPPSGVPFARFTQANGVLAEGVARLIVDNVRFRNMAGFAVLVDRKSVV